MVSLRLDIFNYGLKFKLSAYNNNFSYLQELSTEGGKKIIIIHRFVSAKCSMKSI